MKRLQKRREKTGTKQKGKGKNPPKKSTISDETSDVLCPACSTHDTDSDTNTWVCCDICDAWYHAGCTSITPEDYANIGIVVLANRLMYRNSVESIIFLNFWWASLGKN